MPLLTDLRRLCAAAVARDGLRPTAAKLGIDPRHLQLWLRGKKGLGQQKLERLHDLLADQPLSSGNLTPELAEVLRDLRGCDEPVSVAELADWIGTSHATMRNRLRELEQRGLAVGETVGRRAMWRAIS